MSFLSNVLKGVKKPWEITGIASTADYLEYLPGADEFRKHAPGSQPIKAVIPHDVPQLVFNTRYYVRDYRRHNKYSMRKVDRSPLDFSQVRAVVELMASMPIKPEDVSYAPRSAMVNDRGV
ncbi:hypothetical protein COO60DRAFT_1638175 [Scenedesmus sp. NREL 46B-D3]|nr:hypothetical protein COO60DRAFT_1638175 [Scenedesmus sp. NREL 46B-D3]